MNKVIVLGGGPAGMMAAITAASRGARVVLLEKKPSVGKKLSITGKGRCNLTSSVGIDEFVDHYPGNGRFLYSALHQFSNHDLMAFFESQGVRLKVERGNRVFPVSDQANDIVQALRQSLADRQVEIITNLSATRLQNMEGSISGVDTPSGRVDGQAIIIATGGLSYPSTGSTGDGYRLARQVGHHIIEPRPGLVPLVVQEAWVQRLQGLSLRNVRAVSYDHTGKKINQACGELLFTHFGVSGPIVLSMSSDMIRSWYQHRQNLTLILDLKPALTPETLDERVLRDFSKNVRKQFKNALDDLLPRLLIPVIVELSGIDPLKPCHGVTRQERLRLVELLKGLCLTITGPRPIKEAIITAGGVDVAQVDPRTMASRLVQGLYFAGEVLDVDGYTGGFNLQAAFSTGYVAGFHASQSLA